MRNSLIVVAAFFALGFGGWTLVAALRSSPNEISVGEEPEEITYICTETGKISHGEWQATPALNPATGRRTLVQALYCAKCRKWYQTPPPEMLEKSPRGPVCPFSGETLSTEGP